MDKIMTRNKSMEKALLQMTQSFINLVKANNKTIDDVRKQAEAHKSLRDVFVIDNIMKPLWDAYQHELEERKEMDFTDVIVKATKYCEEGKWNKKYDFILIDEFQDISVDRYRFLLSLRTETPKTKLYCVGDDWQSIYRFTGSDLSLFSEFSKYFGYTEECKIETTYRFGNPLIQKSSLFVQNNPLQKKKNVRPRSVNPPETKISFMGYKDNKNLQNL
jgi:DNA helicase-4